jgi:hypothetical protein
LQYIDALPVSQILNTNSEYKSVKEYLRKNNPSDTDRHGIASEVMDAYVRSSGTQLFSEGKSFSLVKNPFQFKLKPVT